MDPVEELSTYLKSLLAQGLSLREVSRRSKLSPGHLADLKKKKPKTVTVATYSALKGVKL